MATTQTNQTAAAKTAKPKKEPVALSKRVDDQVTKAVLGGKMTAEELKKLATRMTRLHAFVSGAEEV